MHRGEKRYKLQQCKTYSTEWKSEFSPKNRFLSKNYGHMIVNFLNKIQAYDVCEAQTSSSLPVSSFEIF